MIDINEYERIVKSYRTPLFKYCYYRLHENIELTEETVDDVLHVLYKKWDLLDKSSNIRAWLYRVADREIKSHLKSHEKYYKHNESLEEVLNDGRIDHLYQFDNYFADHVPEEEYMEEIRRCLPEEERWMFTLRFMEKRTLEDTSRIMSIPYSTLRMRITVLERHIRKEIEKIFDK